MQVCRSTKDQYHLSRSSKEYKKCEIIATPQKYEFKNYAFTFQTDSPYLRFFNYHINRLRDIGGLQKMHSAMDPAPQECPDFTGKALGLKNCFGAFLVMMVGVGSAIVLLVIENVMKTQMTKTTQNQSNPIEEENPRAIPAEVWYEPNQNPDDANRPKPLETPVEDLEAIQHI